MPDEDFRPGEPLAPAGDEYAPDDPDVAAVSGPITGKQRPDSQLPGEAHRARGQLGATSEPIETDVAAGARNMTDTYDTGERDDSLGDLHGVPANTSDPAGGTSEAMPPVQGLRVARDDEPQ